MLINKQNFKEQNYNEMNEQSYHDYLLNIIYNHEIIANIPLAFLKRITYTLISPLNNGLKKEDVSRFIIEREEVKQKNLKLFKKEILLKMNFVCRME